MCRTAPPGKIGGMSTRRLPVRVIVASLLALSGAVALAQPRAAAPLDRLQTRAER